MQKMLSGVYRSEKLTLTLLKLVMCYYRRHCIQRLHSKLGVSYLMEKCHLCSNMTAEVNKDYGSTSSNANVY